MKYSLHRCYLWRVSHSQTQLIYFINTVWVWFYHHLIDSNQVIQQLSIDLNLNVAQPWLRAFKMLHEAPKYPLWLTSTCTLLLMQESTYALLDLHHIMTSLTSTGNTNRETLLLDQCVSACGLHQGHHETHLQTFCTLEVGEVVPETLTMLVQ